LATPCPQDDLPTYRPARCFDTHNIMSSAAQQPIKFEDSLAELERILRELEDGNATLEESLERYERGVTLLRTCHQHLNDAEQRIKLLSGVGPDGKLLLEDFEHTSVTAKAPARRTPRGDGGN
jgi:exodeoxyribonuclease VII small subunit